ncbi:hypothetical protein G6F65_014018 [Rhizopus arrhizus]|jgi:hypothetical protein|uniref:hypothetical protein n=1 Tax=Achromobacter marplatensis TaxID=470868 RepID=UPI003D030DAF|nr:hypothetical protein G6F65_014018 [Rhizopus arrhizus]
MTDTYQPIYDAVRSRIGHADVGQAVESALREAFGNADHIIRCAVQETVNELQRPAVVFRPALSIDGDQWCALYGANLQDGVAGFGDTPAAAMYAFDRAWLNDKTPLAARGPQ